MDGKPITQSASKTGNALRLDLSDATGRVAPTAMQWLLDRLGEALPEACRREAGRNGGVARGGEVRIRIVGDDEMARMHEEYAGVPGTTDVLTFDLSGDESETPPLDVDIVTCLDEAQRQAARRGGADAPERELLLYALHGVLHCLGHDDHEENNFEAMHRAEDEILTHIGVGPIFRGEEKQ